MSVFHHAVADNDVLRRDTCVAARTSGATIGVTATLDGDTIVASVEDTVLYEHVFARFGIAAIAVGAFIPHLDVAYNNVF